MKKILNNRVIIFVVTFFLITSVLYAQSSDAFLIPGHIFVGDRAVLVLPLEADNTETAFDDIVLLPQSGLLPSDQHIDFHRIVLERRITGNRLLIEFTAFAPGFLELPVIHIGGAYFTDLTITVNSVIQDGSLHILSGAAAALAVPGTAFMIYITIAIIIFAILFVILFMLKGRKLIKKLIQKWKFYRLFNRMRKIEKQLRKAVLKGTDKRIILDRLSDEFRIFLSNLTGVNCRVMTADEFQVSTGESISENFQNKFSLSIFADFFRNCDEQRFSGTVIDKSGILLLLDDLNNFLAMLEKTNKNLQKEEHKHEY
ncbi:MAG: hypothetical protein FWC97_03005 [Treponema sp.]|nr:hypothetical protein [Treponema sp.]